ncbi:MAG: hypothetical protein R2788_04235 [Saprospiraceae bacterium]
MKDKFELYEECAYTLEYWIVDPEHKVVHAATLSRDTGKFTAVIPALTDEDTLTRLFSKGCKFPFWLLFLQMMIIELLF